MTVFRLTPATQPLALQARDLRQQVSPNLRLFTIEGLAWIAEDILTILLDYFYPRAILFDVR
jgi:hypothetical protein